MVYYALPQLLEYKVTVILIMIPSAYTFPVDIDIYSHVAYLTVQQCPHTMSLYNAIILRNYTDLADGL